MNEEINYITKEEEKYKITSENKNEILERKKRQNKSK